MASLKFWSCKLQIQCIGRVVYLTIILYSFLTFSFINTSFLTDQKKYRKVSQAFRECEGDVIAALRQQDIRVKDLNILFVVYKKEDKLLLYAKNRDEGSYKKIREYHICYASGTIGPKRMEGDCQVPEGFYHINVFNPHSTYYLSLGINYPNKSDLIKTTASQPGGNIFIHGDCVSIGCMAMGEYIKELYVYAVHARNNGQQQIPVYIFPFEMNAMNTYVYKKRYATEPSLVNFWNNIWLGFMKFSNEKRTLEFSVNDKGDYVFY